jgi:hypothetical protein
VIQAIIFFTFAALQFEFSYLIPEWRMIRKWFEVSRSYDKGGWITPNLRVPLVHIGWRYGLEWTGVSPFNFLPVFRICFYPVKCAACGDLGKWREIALQLWNFNVYYEYLSCRGIHAKTEPIVSPPESLQLVRQFIPCGESDSAANVTKKQ